MTTKADVIKYAVLPGFIPRISAFFQSGFVHIAYLIAVIYHSFRLLPFGHPYLDPKNIGRFGVRHVIAEAANNLVLDRKNIDQIAVFVLILFGLVLLFAQFVVLVLALMMGHPSYAALSAADLFSNPPGAGVTNPVTGALGPEQDVAFILLDRIFGVGGDGSAPGDTPFFGSCIADIATLCTDLNGNAISTPAAFPFPFHLAMHEMFAFYSYGMFFVGVFVIIYYTASIIAETAATGTAFGQRFNKTWVPVRLIVFLALLIPITNGSYSSGLNAGQLITLSVAKQGSNFATNAWSFFNRGAIGGNVSNSYLSQHQDLIAETNVGVEPVNDLLQFLSVAKVCEKAYNLVNNTEDFNIQPYLVRPQLPLGMTSLQNGPNGGAIAGDPRINSIPFKGSNHAQASEFTLRGDIFIRFGHRGEVVAGEVEKDFKADKGNVKPYCGEMRFKFINLTEPGAADMAQAYYAIVQDIWEDTDLNTTAECIVKKHADHIVPNYSCPEEFDKSFLETESGHYHDQFVTAMRNGITFQRANGIFNLPDEVLERGWAGAAVWYNKIAEMNGVIADAANNIPEGAQMPAVMELVRLENTGQASKVTASSQFNLLMANGDDLNILIDLEDKKEYARFEAMNIVYNAWRKHTQAHGTGPYGRSSNAFIRMVNFMFGTSGLFEMRRNENVHPLSQLSALGKSMMDAVVRNMAIGVSIKAGGSFMGTVTQVFSGQSADAVVDFLFSFVAASVGIAVILFYVLPLMPFIYFMFAVGGWVKSIFEAMVAMPLWALSHLRIDGEGAFGPGSVNGYFLLFEIFLRPFLILMGMIASIASFSAFVSVLNLIFDDVVANVAGFDMELEANIADGTAPPTMGSVLYAATDGVNIFFYTAMYAIVCYMLGLASFKLVDLIPTQILRWMGANVSAFQESTKDPAGTIVSNVNRGSILVSNQIRSQTQGDFSALTYG